jgi:hypothetical protein
MTALFGPQGANATKTLPQGMDKQRYGNEQTWVKDCSAPGASDGTVLDASFHNRIIGNLEYLIAISGVPALPGDFTALHRAVLGVMSADAPALLNTIKELSAAIGNDPNFIGTITAALGNRLRIDINQGLTLVQKQMAQTNLGLSNVAATGQYADLIGRPTLGTAAALDWGTEGLKLVRLTASAKLPALDGSALTEINTDWSRIANKPVFKAIATSGAYADLSGKPTLGSAAAKDSGVAAGNVVTLDGNAKLPAVDGSALQNVTVTWANVSSKPAFFSGAYSDLSGKPTLFDGAYASLSGKPALGTAAAKNIGVAADNVLVLDSTAKIPAVDGSLIFGLGGGFAAGTKMIFMQAAAPSGWTKDTTHDNKALRLVSGTSGGSAGGVQAFSTVFARTAVDAFTPDTNYMPWHGHSYTDQFITAAGRATNNDDSVAIGVASGWGDRGLGTGGAGGGFGHTHGIDLRVQYVDAIICTKN